MPTISRRLVALLVALTLCIALAPASEVDELRAKAAAMKKEAAVLAGQGQREQAERLERQAQDLLQAAEQRERAPTEPEGRPAAPQRDREIHRLEEHLQSLLARERELREHRAPEPELAEMREQIADAERHLHELHGAARPDGDLPPELREQAERVQETMRRIHHVRIAADNLRAADMHDLANELTQRAEEMERDAHEAQQRLAAEMQKRNPAARHEPEDRIEGRLLEEIERLRAEVRELRQRIEQK